MRRLFNLCLAVVLASFLGLAAFVNVAPAQTNLTPQVFTYQGQPYQPAAIYQMGKDTASGNPCFVGITSTCTPSPATVGPTGSTSTDASGTVTLGGTYQTVLTANTARKGCLIQNPTTATEVLSVKVGTMAAPFTIPIGGSFNCTAGTLVVTDAITLTAATTAHAFSAVSQ